MFTVFSHLANYSHLSLMNHFCTVNCSLLHLYCSDFGCTCTQHKCMHARMHVC